MIPPDNYPRVFVGTGSCGLAAGADKVFDAAKTFIRDGGRDIHLVRTGCMGMCHAEPVLEIHVPGRPRVVYGGVEPDRVAEILGTHFFRTRPQDSPELVGQRLADSESIAYPDVPYLAKIPFYAGQRTALLAKSGLIDPHSLVDYEAEGGYRAVREALKSTPEKVLKRVREAGVTGRGGGGFLTADKWQLAADQPPSGKVVRKVVIANGDEGDPGAFSDRTLLESDPHAVVEGLMLAAYATGADSGYIYTRAAYTTAVHRLEVALAFCRKRGYLGDGIFGSGFKLDIQLRKGAGAYICGEETALIATLEGKNPMPEAKPPRPAVVGYMGRPTVVNNVETLATVTFVMAHPKAIADTKLLSLSGAICRPGVVEVPFGTSLREVIFDLGGGMKNGRAFKAVLVGGPDGGFLPEALLDTPIGFDSLKKVGSMLGSGALVVVDDETCMVGLARYFENFEANESCGKCTPCRIGTVRLVERLDRVIAGKADKSELGVMERLCEVVREGSLCGLGRAAPNPITTALAHFKSDFDAHLAGNCPTGQCEQEAQV